MMRKCPAVLTALLLSASLWADNSHLKQTPEDCSDRFLSRHFDAVLPCYLMEDDPAYQWHKQSSSTEQVKLDGKEHSVRVDFLEMNSLRWKAGEEHQVNHPVWKHRIRVYIPSHVSQDSALLYINGGTLYPKDSEAKPSPLNDDLYFAEIAARTQTVVVDLKDIPNQYLQFGSKPPLKEDDLIAYTWEQFLSNPSKNYHWPLRLPMVKATIKTMDTLQSYMKQQNTRINHFVLTGGSKRGWTAWLTAAMDNRVSAVMPMVIDVLNLQVSMAHHNKTYNGWAPAVKSYYHLMPQLGTEAMDKLMQVVDPYSYLPLLKMPKLIITASGDDFFVPDSSRFYFDELKGGKWMRVLPDQRHFIVKQDRTLVTRTIESFYAAVVEERPLPDILWNLSDSYLNIQTSVPPKSAFLWQANNPEKKDFRTSPDNPTVSKFNSQPVQFKCKDICRLSIPEPSVKKGWSAYYVELNYGNSPYRDLTFTTRVFISPDTPSN